MPAASILPVTIHKNKLYFLFGKENPMENSSKGFSDFGGGKEDKTFYDTALREAAEELTGFLGTPKQLKTLIKKQGGTYIIRHQPDTDKEYRVHIFFMEYDPYMIGHFNNNHQYLWDRMDKKMLNESRLFEKIEIRWFCEDELLSSKKHYRHFYFDIVKQIVEEKEKIRKFIKTRMASRKTRCLRCSTKTRKNKTIRKGLKGGR
jgi:hypothetical protein